MARLKINVGPGGRSVLDMEHALYLNRAQAVTLGGSPRLELGVRMRYKIIRASEDDAQPYRITTVAYDHSIARASGEAILDFHWHPNGSSHEIAPHVHLGSSQLAKDAVLTSKTHVATGRVSVERVIRTAVELGAKPLREDWRDRLDETEAPFLQHRSWG